MKEHLKSVTEATLVPLSLVAVIVSAVWIAGHVSFQSDANADAIKKLQEKQDTIGDIKSDLAVVKSKVEFIERKLKE